MHSRATDRQSSQFMAGNLFPMAVACAGLQQEEVPHLSVPDGYGRWKGGQRALVMTSDGPVDAPVISTVHRKTDSIAGPRNMQIPILLPPDR